MPKIQYWIVLNGHHVVRPIKREARDGDIVYRFDIYIQGEKETVFLIFNRDLNLNISSLSSICNHLDEALHANCIKSAWRKWRSSQFIAACFLS